VKHLLCNREALSSNPSITGKKKVLQECFKNKLVLMYLLPFLLCPLVLMFTELLPKLYRLLGRDMRFESKSTTIPLIPYTLLDLEAV
jgi:hypothetical protein